MILRDSHLTRYVDEFTAADEELYAQSVPNAAARDFLAANVPRFACPDPDFERTYYFRWWTFRKHIRLTPAGYVITEFLPPVPWAGPFNTINCAVGHHFYEGRWLHDPIYLDDTARFWLGPHGEPRRYSCWLADALYARHLVSPNPELLVALLDPLLTNHATWERDQRDACGLFWQIDDRDGMEMGIGGTGYRPTINAYMYGDALAIAAIAGLAGRSEVAEEFRARAERIQARVEEVLWDPQAEFYKVVPRGSTQPVDVRELIGYVPWYFNLPRPERAVAWQQLVEPGGFAAPYGPTTAEQRHPRFRIAYEGHECLWDGPSWPYATSQTLTALANLLNGPEQTAIDSGDYFAALAVYTRSHRRQREDGSTVSWIDENLNPYTGDWIARTRLSTWQAGTWSPEKGGRERGKDYNHATYCDLIISGLAGLRPRADDTVVVNPLLPAGQWRYFCLDHVRYHGRLLTLLWDRDGEQYGRGAGLALFVDGQEAARRSDLGRLTARL